MFGALGDIAGLLKNARQMQEKFKTIQEDLARRTYEADAGAGAVRVTVSGRGEVIAVKISPEIVNPQDTETLEELIKAAMNAASRKSQEAMQAEMSQLTAGMNLPGLANMLGMQPPQT